MQDEAETSDAVCDRRDVLTPADQFDQTVNILLFHFTHSHVLFIPVILQAACALAALTYPSHLPV
ncbi:hypothetical protein D5071_04110 [Pectobacterium carotovorum]|uniref:Uncharacterized protein n=1 Tax=Pectobacterium carotovorum TaxID=554 RepID=A0A419B091_PECCA|nr:hypothetical protein D5071_04110 [Pectobacterium carotovorum]